ncbi:Vacuolar morphogenesis protein 6 [Tulasnella sp. 403]|nr:Vacuolar morphogenesis protein 6 [Tulasnella sp. 403]
MQTIPFPFSEDLTAKLSAADPAPVNTPPPSVRLLSASPHAQSPAFVTSTPGDRTVAANEGSAVWSFVMVPWGEQIDELVDAGRYADALTLLNILDVTSLPDKDKRQAHIRGLHAVSVFKEGKYVEAIKTFIDLDINPAKVVALYPESVSGRLSVPQTKWIELFGGKPTKPPELEKEGAPDADKADGGAGGSSIAGQLRATLETLVPAIPEVVSGLSGQDDDAKSIKSVGTVGKGKEKLEKAKGQLPVPAQMAALFIRPSKTADDSRRSIENLLVYLGDRRPKLSGALLAFHITPEKAPDLPDLSETSIEDLFLMPNQPIPSLIPEQLLRYAQIVDTALFKSYLVIRPGLVGSLCRLDNWCEVAEVEEVLRERKKFSELIDLYRTKKMHEKALTLLKELSQGEDDPVEKVDPTALYLQKLGPQHIKLIFSWSNWVLDISPERGLKVFMAEEHELPRKDVASFLAGRDSSLCARYIEYLMEEEHVTDTLFHNWLAEIYMDLIVTAKRRGDEAARSKVYEQLLTFLDTSTYYEVDRIFARLPSDDLYEARAILLGRLGKNEAALDIYVNRLQDFAAAESYCKRVYQTVPNPKGIFLTLLRIYLRPSSAGASASLTPALDLISRHSPRLDSAEVLKMLPPFVNATDVRVFLTEALKAPRIDTRITRELYKARAHQVDRKLMALHSKRVKVADSRICPQCHKRLGNSVIAVHAPRGEVTHYQCREAFVKRKTEATGSR